MTSYLASLQSGLRDAFEADGRVCLLGEDVLDPYGGAFKVSKGLSTEFPGRVLTAPISEGAIAGVATGMAIRGMKPVAEIMFGDFLTLCADQIVNHAAKFRTMYGRDVPVPLVIRTPMGGGRGYGATHSQSIEKMFLGVPNLKVVAPSHVHDPGALLRCAIEENDDPILFIEHKLLYPKDLIDRNGPLEIDWRDADSGFPTALVSNAPGAIPDITVIAYGGMAPPLLEVMEKFRSEEINVLAALPSRLDPLPVDTLKEAALQSRRILIVEEGTEGFTWGAEVSAVLNERLHESFAAPVRRLASLSSIIPTCADGEKDVLVQAEDIERAILEVLS